MLRAIAGVMSGDPTELVSIGDQLWACELALGYTVTDWMAIAEPELRGLLLGIATKTEFPVEAGGALRDRFHLSEFHLSDEVQPEPPPDARGLGAAYLLHGIGAQPAVGGPLDTDETCAPAPVAGRRWPRPR